MNNRYLMNTAGGNAEQWWTHELMSTLQWHGDEEELWGYPDGQSLSKLYPIPFLTTNRIVQLSFVTDIGIYSVKRLSFIFSNTTPMETIYFSTGNKKDVTVKLTLSSSNTSDFNFYLDISNMDTRIGMGKTIKASTSQLQPVYLSTTPPHGDLPARSMRQRHFDQRGGVNVQSGIIIRKNIESHNRKWGDPFYLRQSGCIARPVDSYCGLHLIRRIGAIARRNKQCIFYTLLRCGVFSRGKRSRWRHLSEYQQQRGSETFFSPIRSNRRANYLGQESSGNQLHDYHYFFGIYRKSLVCKSFFAPGISRNRLHVAANSTSFAEVA